MEITFYANEFNEWYTRLVRLGKSGAVKKSLCLTIYSGRKDKGIETSFRLNMYLTA